MDTVTPVQRSAIMRRVKSTHTSLELRVRSMLHRMGLRFRLHAARLPGKPDIVLPRLKLAIFVHGCFWHQHRCKRGNRIPASNRPYWEKKLARNVERFAAQRRELRTLGWRVIIIWECEDLEKAVRAVMKARSAAARAPAKSVRARVR